MKVEFFKHNIGEDEIKAANGVFRSTFLTTGPKTKEFEKKMAEYLGVNYCVGVSSCTAGLFISLKALGIGEGDEVITTPMTFIATSNVIIHAGAKPIFVDVEEYTGNIDAGKIEAAITSKTKAIIPVHLYGHMCDMKVIKAIAAKYNLYIIEDCAHCIEGERDGIKPGQVGNAAVFSFYATKNITSGEGGAIAVNDMELYEKLLKYRLHGMSKSAADRYASAYKHWDMELLGYKCNMNDIQAAMLLPQLERIETILEQKEKICRKYEQAFAEIKEIDFPKIRQNTKHARHIFTVWVDPQKRDNILSTLQEKQIGVAVNFRPVHLLSYYRDTFGYRRGDFPVAEKIGDSTITLPMYAKLTEAEMGYVIEKLRECAIKAIKIEKLRECAIKAIKKLEFDTEIFQVPYYRVKDFNENKIELEFNKLKESGSVIIDAKVDASDKELSNFFHNLGFKKICMQIELELPLNNTEISQIGGDTEVKIAPIFMLPDDLIKKHAENFIYDRFSLDPLISKDKKNKLFFTWIKNSFTDQGIKIAWLNNDFCSFKEREEEIIIDLISVLEKGKNTGTRILKELMHYGAANNFKKIKVVTECENHISVAFYQKNNFKISKFTSCFHFIK